MHFLFVELARFKIEVSFNLFCEKHVKNSRDQHSSVVSNFIQQETFVKKLTSSQDICDAIEKHQNFANIDKERVIAGAKYQEIWKSLYKGLCNTRTLFSTV